MQANIVKCTVCKRRIHKQYSGVRGKLSLVVYGFRCKRYDGTIQKADLSNDRIIIIIIIFI